MVVACKRQVCLLLITLPPGHPVLFSSLHYRVFHGIDVHAVLESLFRGSAHPPPAPFGPMVVPACQAQDNDDYSPDDAQKDHYSHLIDFAPLVSGQLVDSFEFTLWVSFLRTVADCRATAKVRRTRVGSGLWPGPRR